MKPKSPNIITLLSDFGLRDPFVGIMKGVIATINPSACIIDLTHQIPPQNIFSASFVLFQAYRFFPVGTVHLAVVDPGVGGNRRGIAIRTNEFFFVGPDNGIFEKVLEVSPPLMATNLTRSEFWLGENPSPTFHGRDIFAPVAAHLALGKDMEDMGDQIETSIFSHIFEKKKNIFSQESTPLGKISKRPAKIKIAATIQWVDHFGNLITNISDSFVDGHEWFVQVGKHKISARQKYEDVIKGNLLALIGSHGFIEIAVNCGSAQENLKLCEGDSLDIFLA